MFPPLPIPSGGCPLHTVREGGRREEEGYKNRDGDGDGEEERRAKLERKQRKTRMERRKRTIVAGGRGEEEE